MKRACIIVAAVFALGISAASAANCEEPTANCFNTGSSLSSSHFRVLDPQHAAFGGTSSSSSNSFILLGAIGDLAIGISSNSSTNQIKSGFLFFPLIVSPNPTSAVAGANQVTVSWTPLRSGIQTSAGLINQGYKVCYRTTGAYTCVPGTSTATSPFVVGSLTGGTLYTFKIQAFDFYDNLISESDEISATPLSTPTPTPTPTPGGGGGGGGGGFISPSPPGFPDAGTVSAQLTGLAFPFGTIHILYNGVEIATTQTNAAAVFVVEKAGLPAGSANFGFWGTDRLSRRSVTWAFSVPLTAGAGTTRVSGLIVPPTIAPSSTQVQPGSAITVVGESVPGATVEVTLNPGGRSYTALVSPNGSYTVQLPTTGLAVGVYDIRARTLLLPASDASTWSQTIQIGVGVPAPAVCNHPPDVNRDGKINLVDFSIMAFWWKRSVDTNSASDLNCDQRVDLADFSILAYHWTGR